MSVEFFIDTNIFLHHIDDADSRKQEIASEIILDGLESNRHGISYQVVQECMNAGIREAHIPMDLVVARRYLNTVLMPLCKVWPGKGLFEKALDLKARFQFSFYDCLIVAAALEARAKILLSEDLQHGQQIDQLTVRNPFLSTG